MGQAIYQKSISSPLEFKRSSHRECSCIIHRDSFKYPLITVLALQTTSRAPPTPQA